MSLRKEANKQNKISNTIQFTEERHEVHMHSISQTESVLMKKRKAINLLLPSKA